MTSTGPEAATTALTVTAARLRNCVERILQAAGADDEAAGQVASSLVASDLRGVESHGVIRVAEYVRAIQSGRIDPAARPRLVKKSGAVVVLAGERSFGQVAARELVGLATDQARAHGVALATLAGVNHVGRLGEWVELAADHGCVALAWCNCGESGGNVVPFGGRAARLGTNPIAYAVPAGSGRTVVADFATSVVAEGKVRLFLQSGRPTPDGWIVDADGTATTDPAELYGGGAILPMGGHKGFALGLLVEILGGIVAGAGCVALGDTPGNGVVLVAIDPSQTSAGDFPARVAALLDAVKSSPPDADDGPGVLIPGEPEVAISTQRELDGIPLSVVTWSSLVETGRALGVAVDETPQITGRTGSKHVV